jgi:hypothetical protein
MQLTPRVGSDDVSLHPPLSDRLLDRAQDQLGMLRHRELGRTLGPCMRCGKAVRTQQNYVRQDGYVAHVRCRLTPPVTRSTLS